MAIAAAASAMVAENHDRDFGVHGDAIFVLQYFENGTRDACMFSYFCLSEKKRQEQERSSKISLSLILLRNIVGISTNIHYFNITP